MSSQFRRHCTLSRKTVRVRQAPCVQQLALVCSETFVEMLQAQHCYQIRIYINLLTTILPTVMTP